ncbi:Spore coat protein U domain-containing protein [Burkholderiales bacterium 8X]|nr:Spore coat protein U domain-containing protein [Burkholderiales bacterium 8X]
MSVFAQRLSSRARSWGLCVALSLSMCLLLLSQPVQAGTATAFFQVTATVLSACSVTTPGTLAFGSYTPNNASAASGTTAFQVTCTSGTPYSIGLSQGGGSGATVTTRKMTSATAGAGNNTLNYGLYKDSAHTVNWDNSSSATGYVGAGNAQPFTVYGSIPAGQYAAAPASDYADSITLTLSY